MANSKQITESKVRAIAREEALKVQTELIKDIAEIKEATSTNKDTLESIKRLLMGEFKEDSAQALKGKAEFAYQYAKKNTDLGIVVRALPAIAWFERMDTPEPGDDLSALQKLGKIINSYDKIAWLWGLVGASLITNLLTSAPRMIEIITNLFNGH
jgi:hypothetical protein